MAEQRSANAASVSMRRKRAEESFKSAAECIGPIEKDMALFAVTRGQWSMIDAILHCLDCVGPSEMSLWTWTVAEYEIQCLERLMLDKRLLRATLVIDHGARNKNRSLLDKWISLFGDRSIRFVVNHSKIATIQSAEHRLLLRGSMNLNFNPRFEQFDITEGGPDFDLVRQIESELEPLPMSCTGADVYKQSRVSEAFDQQTLDLFQGVKTWAK